jgi:hypothetical protein
VDTIMRQRPDQFTLKNDHALARGLVFAGLGASPGSTRYHDSSVFGKHGTLTNMEPSSDWVWDDRGCSSLLCDGTTDYVSIPSNALYQSAIFSLSLWCRQISDLGASRSIVAMTQQDGVVTGWNLWYEGTTEIRFTCPQYNSIANKSGITCANWNHVSATFDGSTIKIYVNGVKGTDKTSVTYTPQNRPITIGLGKYYCNCQVSDFLLYNRVLTLPEIQQLADPSNVTLSGLIQPPKRRYFTVPYYIPPVARKATYYTFKTSFGKLSVKG